MNRNNRRAKKYRKGDRKQEREGQTDRKKRDIQIGIDQRDRASASESYRIETFETAPQVKLLPLRTEGFVVSGFTQPTPKRTQKCLSIFDQKKVKKN